MDDARAKALDSLRLAIDSNRAALDDILAVSKYSGGVGLTYDPKFLHMSGILDKMHQAWLSGDVEGAWLAYRDFGSNGSE